MKRARALEEEIKGRTRFWSGSEESIGVNKMKEPESCRNCSLVKWYPPLLTISTVMAGVFCWLYVTKPVMISQSVPLTAGTAETLLVSGHPDRNGDVEVHAQAITPVTSLNPDLGFLPGEGEGAGKGRFADHVPGQETEPVRVKRSSRPLFEPLVEEEVEVTPMDSETPEVTDVLVAEEVSVDPGFEEESSDGAVEPAEEEAVEASAEVMPEDANLDFELEAEGAVYRVAISLMGDLVSDPDPGETAITASIDD